MAFSVMQLAARGSERAAQNTPAYNAVKSPLGGPSEESMKASIRSLLQRLPGPVTAGSPGGERFVQALAHGSMSVELYAPRGSDPQQLHQQDELYFIHAGTGRFRLGSEMHEFDAGTCFFVPAGVVHRFENFSDDFAAWVVFWGPVGGEPQLPVNN
jgi:mannose-6-phosphate isomerase-like protein (cupin superfamily)